MKYLEFRSKKTLNKRYLNKFNVKLSFKDIDQKPIKIVAKKLAKKRMNKKYNEAATLIQKNFRRYFRIKKYKELQERRNKAAGVIQRKWKSIRFRRLIPKLKTLHKNKAANLKKFMPAQITMEEPLVYATNCQLNPVGSASGAIHKEISHGLATTPETSNAGRLKLRDHIRGDAQYT